MEEFDVRQVAYFIEAQAAGSMSKAAKRLGVSEQALSHGISKLESALGEALFERSPAGIAPTAFGRFFAKRAHLLKAAFDLAVRSPEDFRAHQGPRRIVVGALRDCIADYGGTLDIAGMQRMRALFPDVELDFEVCPATELHARLANGTYRFGIGATTSDEAFAERTLRSYPLAVIASKRNPLAARVSVTLGDLEGCRLALSADDMPLRRYLERVWGEGFRRVDTLVFRIAPVDRADYISAPDVVAVLPQQHALRTVKSTESVVLPLVDGRGEPVCVALALQWLKRRPLAGVERSLVEYLAMLYENGRAGCPTATDPAL